MMKGPASQPDFFCHEGITYLSTKDKVFTYTETTAK